MIDMVMQQQQERKKREQEEMLIIMNYLSNSLTLPSIKEFNTVSVGYDTINEVGNTIALRNDISPILINQVMIAKIVPLDSIPKVGDYVSSYIKPKNYNIINLEEFKRLKYLRIVLLDGTSYDVLA